MKNNQVFVVNGCKGGVGKTFVSLAFVDTLLSMGTDVLVVECDSENPDVYSAYKHLGDKCVTQFLENEEEAIEFSGVIEKHPDSCIILNLPAGGKFKNCIEILSNVCSELKRELVSLWVLGTERYSVAQLVAYRKICGDSQIFAIVNSHFGCEEKFNIYHVSEVKKAIKTIVFPKLVGSVASKVRGKMLSFTTAMEAKDKEGLRFLSIGERSALSRFQGQVKDCFSDMLSHFGLTKVGDGS